MKQKVSIRMASPLIELVDREVERVGTNRSEVLCILVREALEARSAKIERETTSRPPLTTSNRPGPADMLRPPSVPDPRPERPHYHRYTTFLREVAAVKGQRFGAYECECGKTTSRPLDRWDAAMVDTSSTLKENP